MNIDNLFIACILIIFKALEDQNVRKKFNACVPNNCETAQ